MSYKSCFLKLLAAIFVFSCLSCGGGPAKDVASGASTSVLPQKSQESISPLAKPSAAVTTAQATEPELAGEFFNIPVPLTNYYFAKRVVATFNAPWRGTPQTLAELEDMTWQELLLSYEAFRRNIEVSQQEVDEEVEKTLQADKVTFKWKEDRLAYESWVKEKLNESTELFENQIKHLVQLRKLEEQVIDSIEPQVSEEEAYNKFLDEYNSLSVELVEFENIEEAYAFYKEARKPISESALDNLILDDAFYSFEVLRRGITLSEEEKDMAVTLVLRELNAFFRWKENPEQLREWVEKNIGIDTEVFKERVIIIATIDALRQKIYNKQEPPLDADSRYATFLKNKRDMNRTYTDFFKNFTIDKGKLLRFNSLKEAKQFYEKLHRQAGYWADQRRLQPKKFRRPGFVSLDFLINIWGFKREDAYAMLDKKVGSFYPPAPIYKGYGVFKILDVRKAEKAKYEERKQYYFDRVKQIKKYQGFTDWLKQLKEDANIKVFITDKDIKTNDR